ncbi:MAG: YraN family protein [Clostridia bacterium]|nr:YraN family protein [Clostridia bacterium]
MFNENTWKYGEEKVQNYMKKNGYKILYTNFSCVGVELDIVSIFPKKSQIKKLKIKLKNDIKKLKENNEKDKILVFKNNFKNCINNLTDLFVITEVKSRATDKYGLGSEAVNDYKIKNIKKGANYFLLKDEYKNMQVRFDVASVDGENLTYIENAFY